MNHIHKYIRAVLGETRIVKDADGKRRIEKGGGYVVYKCAIPGCTHYVPRELVIGRNSVCWRCGATMTMTPYSITLKKPHHRECVRSNVA